MNDQPHPPDVSPRPKPQVPPSSCQGKKYMSLKRWSSLWYQVSLISELQPQTVLEIGVGGGVLKAVCQTLGIAVQTADIDPELTPDFVSSVQRLPLQDQSFELTCAFQVLEHVPYSEAIVGFRELCRVSRRHILLSLPNAARAYPQQLTIPPLGNVRVTIPGPLRPFPQMIPSHCGEIGRPGTRLRQVIQDLGAETRLVREFRVFENPYHHFFQFERR
ncbi:MAG: class I SAM-dependent methyltransferase [Planctomycetaceae bacterium]|jgi:hypothetical protein